MDIRQSSLYASFLTKINWQIKKIDHCYIFIKNIPFYGKFAKLQRIPPPIPFNKIASFITKEKIKKIIIEPNAYENFFLKEKFLKNGYQVNPSPYLPTKTILINLKPSQEQIFKSFHQAKRRAVRKAQKNKVFVEISQDIHPFIKLKAKNFFPLGFLLSKEIQALWQTFYPHHALLLTASSSLIKSPKKILAAILLLFWQKKAHYWLAVSTKEGNQLAAPSLLVWEALKIAKNKGCTLFDFEGIYDPRFHQATQSWQGFTKFKQGFNGKEVNYLGSFYLTSQ